MSQHLRIIVIINEEYGKNMANKTAIVANMYFSSHINKKKQAYTHDSTH